MKSWKNNLNKKKKKRKEIKKRTKKGEKIPIKVIEGIWRIIKCKNCI
jgi:hypothetical protein